VLDVVVRRAGQFLQLVGREIEPARDLGDLKLPRLEELGIVRRNPEPRIRRAVIEREEFVRLVDALMLAV
jgi:hypothetical protein